MGCFAGSRTVPAYGQNMGDERCYEAEPDESEIDLVERLAHGIKPMDEPGHNKEDNKYVDAQGHVEASDLNGVRTERCGGRTDLRSGSLVICCYHPLFGTYFPLSTSPKPTSAPTPHHGAHYRLCRAKNMLVASWSGQAYLSILIGFSGRRRQAYRQARASNCLPRFAPNELTDHTQPSLAQLWMEGKQDSRCVT